MNDTVDQHIFLSACLDKIYTRLTHGDEPSDEIIREEATKAKLPLSAIEAMMRLDKRFLRSKDGWSVQVKRDRWPEIALALPKILAEGLDIRELTRQVIIEMDAATSAHFDEYYPADLPESLNNRIAQLIEPYALDTVTQCKGMLFDLVMSELFDNADQNRFFTPRAIPTVAASWAHPKPGDRIIDPCYGSGGFLIAMAQVTERSLIQSRTLVQDQSTLFETSYAYKLDLDRTGSKSNISIINKMIFGMDVDPVAAWSGQTNLALNGYSGANLLRADALDLNRSPFPMESFDIVAGNPPFGDKISDPYILGQFQLGHDSKGRLLNQQLSDILFIEAFLRYAKSGGKVVILVPDGVLTNTTVQVVRDFIIQNAIVEGIISLPRRVFRNDAKSNILFIRKKGPLEERQKEPVFLASVDNITASLSEAYQKMLAGPGVR